MTGKQFGVGIAGCGNIASAYVKDLITYADIALLGVTDIDTDRARSFAAQNGTRAYDSLDSLLADPQVDIVIDLATHHAHFDINLAALKAGKHVYSEKPLALTTAQAKALVDIARQHNRRLAASPFTLMGEAQQTAWKLIRDGKLGTVRVAFAEVNWGRIEAWHPSPQAFYDVGPLFDVGVYPLTILAAVFGPARKVTAYGHVVYPDRATRQGTAFRLSTPDFVVAAIEYQTGAVARLTADFYVSNATTGQTGIEFHGDLGSLHLDSWHSPDSALKFGEFGKPLEPIQPLRQAGQAIRWGAGIHELVTALQDNRPHRFSGELAAHIVEILDATAQSYRSGQTVGISSSFDPPAPAEWAR